MIASLVFSLAVACDNDICTSNAALVTAIQLCTDPSCGTETIQSWNIAQVDSFNQAFTNSFYASLNLTGWANQIEATIFEAFFLDYDGVTVYGLENFDVSKVTNMKSMFEESQITNCEISNWVVANVTTMARMFWSSAFNQDISEWDVSAVRNMSNMFAYSDFNQDISNWKVSVDCDVQDMFLGSSINQDLSSWPSFGLPVDKILSRYGLGVDYPAGCLPGASTPPCPYTAAPTQPKPTENPTTSFPTTSPTTSPTAAPTTSYPTSPPTTITPTSKPTISQTKSPTTSPRTSNPTISPTGLPVQTDSSRRTVNIVLGVSGGIVLLLAIFRPCKKRKGASSLTTNIF